MSAGVFEYFASGNTASGFVCDFTQIFNADKLKRIYIIKGGPGTGKSTLMRKAARAAHEAGLDTELYLCSSDPKSLDGVLIPELSTAIIDGTSPHMTDAVYPGAVERVVNLYAYLDNGKLEKSRDELILLADTQRRKNACALQYLKYCGELYKTRLACLSEAVLTDKLTAAAHREVKSIRSNCKKDKKRRITAFSTRGEVRLDTFEKMAKTKIFAGDVNGIAPLYLDAIRADLCDRGVYHEYSDSLLTGHTEAVYVPSASLCAVYGVKTDCEGGKYINPRRFTDNVKLRGIKNKLIFLAKTAESFKNGALESLSRVKAAHEKIEAIYSSAADFDGINGITEKIISELGLPMGQDI